MRKTIKWGILGPGAIARKFVQDLKLLSDAEIIAVGSRSKDKALAFAKEYGIENAYGSYEELVNDPQVEIIYVATPHPAHKEGTLLCLKAGKAVLCEKPFTVNAKEAEELIDYARKSKIFLMEAMWTRFIPVIVKVREWLTAGIIGEVKMVKADFGFRGNLDPKSRLFNLELGGGSLLDVGVYTISFASMIFGGDHPLNISSMSHIGETGADEEFSTILGYENGKLATLSGAVRTDMPQDAWILGSKGRVYIPDFWHAKTATLYIEGREKEVIEMPFDSMGLQFEAVEAMNCLREGKLESEVIPLNESLVIMKTMDRIREQWGLKYPCE
jgi:dihydrodiol dehydrogenase / D-xylose 1-dehydrogenase (NADP)